MDTLNEKIDRPSQEVAPKAGVAAIVVLTLVAAGVGFVIYKRRRRSLMKRLQGAMPQMDEIRASLKRPLERAVKVL